MLDTYLYLVNHMSVNEERERIDITNYNEGRKRIKDHEIMPALLFWIGAHAEYDHQKSSKNNSILVQEQCE